MRYRPIVFALLAAVPALAQMPPGKWWKDPSFQKDLALTAAQQRDIENLFAAQRDRLIDLRAVVEKKENAIGDAFDTDPFDEAKARAAIDAREHARTEMIKAEMDIQIGIRKLLTSEQFEKLKRRAPGGGMPGEGGPPMGPGNRPHPPGGGPGMGGPGMGGPGMGGPGGPGMGGPPMGGPPGGKRPGGDPPPPPPEDPGHP
ncbi:MAG: periplasmic heavy metal sensor [Acidobacteriota bacterium]